MIVDLKLLTLSKADYDKFKTLWKRKHNFKSSTFWLAILGLVLGITTITINIWNVLSPANEYLTVYGATWSKILFDSLGYFTQQSNTIVIITYILFLTCFRTKIFNSRNLLVAAGIYINLTMTTYWFLMFPEWIMGTLSTYAWWTIFTTISFHLFCPVIYDLFLFINVNYPYKKIKNPMNRIHSKYFVPSVLIYIALYSMFLVMINFIRLPEDAFRTTIFDLDGQPIFSELVKSHPYASIYNVLTNFNQDCWNIRYFNPTFPELGVCYNTNSYGQILYMLLIFPLLIILGGNLVWVIVVNNHKATPKTMRIDVLRQKVMIDQEIQGIYRKHLTNFEAQVVISSDLNSKDNKNKGKQPKKVQKKKNGK